MVKGYLWSGLGLIVAGGIFLAVTNRGGRSNKLGLVVGVLIIALGLWRIVQSRRQPPPPPV
jgi:hypothetical protein